MLVVTDEVKRDLARFIGDKGVLRAEMSIGIDVRYRGNGGYERLKRHPGEEAVKAGEAVRDARANGKRGIAIDFAADLVSIARQKPIPGIAHKGEAESIGKQATGSAWHSYRPVHFMRIAKRVEAHASKRRERCLDAGT